MTKVIFDAGVGGSNLRTILGVVMGSSIFKVGRGGARVDVSAVTFKPIAPLPWMTVVVSIGLESSSGTVVQSVDKVSGTSQS